jgi:hypothetical protein
MLISSSACAAAIYPIVRPDRRYPIFMTCRVSVVAVSDIAGSQMRQCQGSPDSCDHRSDPQAGHGPAGSPASFSTIVPEIGVPLCAGLFSFISFFS